jgi:anti-sigma-K factor RskA
MIADRTLEMDSERHVIELIPAYALDCLEREEAAGIAAHLAICASCRAELAAYQSVSDRLGLAAPEVTPPPALKARLMQQIEASRPAAAARPAQREGRGGFFRRPARALAPAWALASLALVLLLAASTLVLWRQANDRRQARVADMRVIAMAGTPATPEAYGVLVMSADGEYGTLVVDRLPALDQSHQYQLWLIRPDGQRVSGGVFSVGQHGYAALEIWSQDPLSSFPAFGVTVEPAGGSPGPTGEKVLGGSL